MQQLTGYEVVPTITTKFGDKIKYLKSMYNKHYQLPTYEAYWPAYDHYLFTTPESFVQHHEQFDKLWTLFNEFEFGTLWGEHSGFSFYGPAYEGEYPYFFSQFGKQYSGSKYSTYGYPTSYLPTKYEAYPTSYYSEFFGNDSFKPYKPYLSRSGVLNPIDTVIGELEGELTKLKVQKEWPYEFSTTSPTVYTPPVSYFPTSASSFF